jgi:hypothetical protein
MEAAIYSELFIRIVTQKTTISILLRKQKYCHLIECDYRRGLNWWSDLLDKQLVTIYLWLYSPCGPWSPFQFLNLYTVDRTPWTVDPLVARPLPTSRTSQTQNKRSQTSMPRVRFKPTIPEFERAKTVYDLYRDHCNRLTTPDYTLQITVTHWPMFTLTIFTALLGSGVQRRSVVAFRVQRLLSSLAGIFQLQLPSWINWLQTAEHNRLLM